MSSVLHGAGGNDASLADRAVDEQKRQADPEPRDDLALNLYLHRDVCFFLLGLFFSFHVLPPRAVPRLSCASTQGPVNCSEPRLFKNIRAGNAQTRKCEIDDSS